METVRGHHVDGIAEDLLLAANEVCGTLVLVACVRKEEVALDKRK